MGTGLWQHEHPIVRDGMNSHGMTVPNDFDSRENDHG